MGGQTFRVRVRGFKPLREIASKIGDPRTMARLLEVSGIELRRIIREDYLSGQRVNVITGRYRDSIELRLFGAKAVVVGTVEPRARMFEFARTLKQRGRRSAGRGGRTRQSRARLSSKDRSHFKPALFRTRQKSPKLWVEELRKIAARVNTNDGFR